MFGEPIREPTVDLADVAAALTHRGLLTRGPREARDAIQRYFDCELTASGEDCWGIARLREAIHDVDPHLACVVIIISSHTHWAPGDFIVEQFDEGDAVYRIGPSEFLPDAIKYPLLPMSFVLAPEGPVAFEWADASTGLADSPDLDRLWSGIEKLHKRLADEVALDEWPLGLSVHHRFKDLWSPPHFGTLEAPAADPAYAEVREALAPPVDTEDVVQVAWSAFVPEQLTPEEQLSLARLDAVVREIGDERAARALAELRQLARVRQKER